MCDHVLESVYLILHYTAVNELQTDDCNNVNIICTCTYDCNNDVHVSMCFNHFSFVTSNCWTVEDVSSINAQHFDPPIN